MYTRYDVGSGQLKQMEYKPFRYGNSDDISLPITGISGIDPTIHSIPSTEDEPSYHMDDNDNGYLHIIANGVSHDVINIEAVTISKINDPNSYQVITASTVIDSLIQRQDVILR